MQTGLRGKRVLLTGGSGLIGGAMLPRLLNSDLEVLYSLGRSKHGANARERLRARAGDVVDEFGSRLRIIEGDLQEPGWNLSPADRRKIVEETDIVVHCGASTYFQREVECRRTNEEAVQTLIEMCVESPTKKKLCYLGSAACGGLQRDRVVQEDDYPRPDDNHFVYYTRSKSNAETMLRASRDHYDLVIVRPSYVFPERTAPTKFMNDSLWPLVSMLEVEAIPVRSEARVDFVLVDAVCDYIMRLISGPHSHETYHVSTGEIASYMWRNILIRTAEATGRSKLPDFLTSDEYAARKRSLSEEHRLRVGRLGVYIPFMNQNIVFDNRRVIQDCGPSDSLFDFLDDYLMDVMHQVAPR